MSTTGKLFRFRKSDHDLFDTVVNGKKTVETRACEPKYAKIKIGDNITLACGKDRFTARVMKITRFKSLNSLLRTYRFDMINPLVKSRSKLLKMYGGFPNYDKLIKKYGLVTFEFKNRPRR